MSEARGRDPGRCTATRRDGRPCTAQVVGNGRQCWAHDPALAAKRAATRHKGGQNRATRLRLAKLMPLHLVPVFETLRDVFDDVIADRIEPKNAQAAAAVARALVAVLQAGEVEARLRALEERTG